MRGSDLVLLWFVIPLMNHSFNRHLTCKHYHTIIKPSSHQGSMIQSRIAWTSQAAANRGWLVSMIEGCQCGHLPFGASLLFASPNDFTAICKFSILSHAWTVLKICFTPEINPSINTWSTHESTHAGQGPSANEVSSIDDAGRASKTLVRHVTPRAPLDRESWVKPWSNQWWSIQ